MTNKERIQANNAELREAIEMAESLPEAGGGGAIDARIDGSITEISSNVTTVHKYAFDSCGNLKSVRLPMATSVGTSGFHGCKALQTAHIPKVTQLGGAAFDGCTNLQSADFPLVTSIGASGFTSCEKLTSVNFPLASSAGQYAFSYCDSLLTAALGKVATLAFYTFVHCYNLNTVDLGETKTIQNNAFSDCYRLKAVILRSTTMCSLGNTGAFTRCYHFSGTTNSTYNPDGLQDGYIYVPSALIEDYKAATNWSTYATQFRAIEDYPEVCGG